jgi:hypothetical protein
MNSRYTFSFACQVLRNAEKLQKTFVGKLQDVLRHVQITSPATQYTLEWLESQLRAENTSPKQHSSRLDSHDVLLESASERSAAPLQQNSTTSHSDTPIANDSSTASQVAEGKSSEPINAEDTAPLAVQ